MPQLHIVNLEHAQSIKDARTATNPVTSGRPALWRRATAEIIDRLVPLPLMALIFPRWTLAVLAYHLLCDCTPARRSFGKWCCRLRVVQASSRRDCDRWRAALRRIGSALSQTAWCLWTGIPIVLLYELGSLACVLLSAEGRRPEDYLAGTRVVTEQAYRRSQSQR